MDQQPPSTPRSHSRTFSYRSDKSSGSKTKEELVESPKDKERRDQLWKGLSKANPNAAINEAQPGDQAIHETTTIAPLRSIQHTDNKGNVIVDPDLSNPTRPRLERPLDTIRSFEKAIDQGYKRRTSIRSESYDQSSQYNQSRRSSHFGGEYTHAKQHSSIANRLREGYDGASSPNRYSQVNGGGGGYYGSQQRPDSSMAPGPSGPPRMRYGPRQQSDPMMYGRPGHPQHGYQMSQDTTNTAITNGSDSTGPWANSTNPSSENSSIDKTHPAIKPHGDDTYGANGYHRSIPEEGGAYPMRPGASIPPQANGQRRPIPLGNSTTASNPLPPLPTQTKPEAEKRKSWLKRRFSKNG